MPLSRIAFLASASRTGSGTFERILGDTIGGRTIDTAGVYQPGPVYFYAGYDSLEVARYALASRTNFRAEAGVRLGDLWVSGGLIRRGATTLMPPGEIVTDTVVGIGRPNRGEATARTVAVRGRLFKSLYADAWGIAWDDTAGFYRPRYQSRAELYIQTNLLDRFPKGNFGLLTSLAHEYRSRGELPATRRLGDHHRPHPNARVQARAPHPDGGGVVSVPERASGAVPAGARDSTCPARPSSTASDGNSGIDNLVVTT